MPISSLFLAKLAAALIDRSFYFSASFCDSTMSTSFSFAAFSYPESS